MSSSEEEINKPEWAFWMFGFVAAAGFFVIGSGVWDVFKNGGSWISVASTLTLGLTLLCLSASQMVSERRKVLRYTFISIGLVSAVASLITAFMG